MRIGRYVVVCKFEFEGYPDFYSGHSDTFKIEKGLLACIPFSIHVDYSETVGEIIERVLEDINASMSPIHFYTEDNEIQEEIREILTDEVLRKAMLGNRRGKAER